MNKRVPPIRSTSKGLEVSGKARANLVNAGGEVSSEMQLAKCRRTHHVLLFVPSRYAVMSSAKTTGTTVVLGAAAALSIALLYKTLRKSSSSSSFDETQDMNHQRERIPSKIKRMSTANRRATIFAGGLLYEHGN